MTRKRCYPLTLKTKIRFSCGQLATNLCGNQLDTQQHDLGWLFLGLWFPSEAHGHLTSYYSFQASPRHGHSGCQPSGGVRLNSEP